MGTNFYTKTGEHIGKRAAAGAYCKKCGLPFIDEGIEEWSGKKVYGTDAVHVSNAKYLPFCPICQKPRDESLGVCSFTFAVSPKRLFRIMFSGEEIEDEYGKTYSSEEFKKELQDYPIKYWHMVGTDFC